LLISAIIPLIKTFLEDTL
jgi:hypothetical protein